MPFLIIIVLIVVLVIVGIGMYNGLVKARVRVDEAWSDITVQLKRRADLIPNLVNTVKGYAKHEKSVFEEVTKARTAVMDATANGTPGQVAEAENQFSATLKSLFAVAEAYPDLKANENFLQLQADLTDTENKIQASRRFYNGATRDYNIKTETVPSSIIASMFGFARREFFEVEDRATIEQPVDVQF